MGSTHLQTLLQRTDHQPLDRVGSSRTRWASAWHPHVRLACNALEPFRGSGDQQTVWIYKLVYPKKLMGFPMILADQFEGWSGMRAPWVWHLDDPTCFRMSLAVDQFFGMVRSASSLRFPNVAEDNGETNTFKWRPMRLSIVGNKKL